uniref:C2H2-type domain-containing protein n=1 Tax=Stomoxys calcitrans TaxID=35570 RepID=A0A1I8P051_STOCA
MVKHSSGRNSADITQSTLAAAINGAAGGGSAGLNEVNRKRMSMSDVSDMLYEFYRANAAAKVPKQQPQGSVLGAVVSKYCGQTSPTSAETLEPSSIAAIATNGAASETASKNGYSGEVVNESSATSDSVSAAGASAFHPKLKYTLKAKLETPTVTAIPTSVLTATPNNNDEPLDIKPIINPTTGLVEPPLNSNGESVIKPVPVLNPATAAANPQAAAIAAALFRDGYHNFQQHIRAQEILKFQTAKFKPGNKTNESTPTKILENFLRQQRKSECDQSSDQNDGDDEDDSRFNTFDDIHLMEGSKGGVLPQLLQNAFASNSTPGTPGSADYLSDESQKYMNLAAQAQAFGNLSYSLGDFNNTSPNDNSGATGVGPDGEPIYECRHCGKKYRWKSTLRRHENVECGGKEPSHQCPYCPYKSKQRGNLGVHVRKHHSNLPQLASRRRSKYSMKLEANSASMASVSDDSNSKLVIDCSK